MEDERWKENLQDDAISEESYNKEVEFLESLKAVDEMDYDSFLKIYGYYHMSYRGKKTLDRIQDKDFYVFRDDFYSVLLECNISQELASEITFRGIWSLEYRHKGYEELLEKMGASEKLVGYFRNVYNLWGKAPCITRVQLLYQQGWYQQNYPQEYAEVLKEVM